jgi:hypothetical protein
MAAQKPRIYCPHCKRLAPATRLTWDDITEERIWGEGDGLEMGPYVYQSNPKIHYFRRVRKCSNCGELIRTAEVDERLLRELAELRTKLAQLKEEAPRAADAANAIRALLD